MNTIEGTSAGGMRISDIFSRSFKIYKENPIIIVPSLILLPWDIIASMFLIGSWDVLLAFLSGDFTAFLATLTTFLVGWVIFLIVLVILYFLAAGIMIVMIKDAFEGRSVSLSSAYESVKDKIVTLTVASVLFGIIVILGYIFLIIPGVILLYLLYFFAHTIMLDDEGVVSSIGASYRFVRSNLLDSVIIVTSSVAIGAFLPESLIGTILFLLAMPFLILLATLLYIDRR